MTEGIRPCGSAREWVHRPGTLIWRRAYPEGAVHAAAARKFTALLLADTGRGEDAEWITSELVSNALKFSRSGAYGGWFGVEVRLEAGLARITVLDLGGGGVPAVVPAPPQGMEPAERGLGLRGVAALAVRMGFDGTPELGHAVWAELDLHAEADRRTDARQVGLDDAAELSSLRAEFPLWTFQVDRRRRWTAVCGDQLIIIASSAAELRSWIQVRTQPLRGRG